MLRSKRIIPITFLIFFSIVLFNYVFFTVFIKYKKSDFRKELITSSTSSIQTMQISKDDIFRNKKGIEWKEHNKEIVINGCYFEVVKIEEANNLATLYLIKDEKENKLFASFLSNQGKSNDFIFSIVKLISGLRVTETIQLDFGNANRVEIVVLQPVYSKVFFDSAHQFKKIKPPRFIS